MPLSKIDGTRNPAGLMTKHLESTKTAVHLHTMYMVFKDGRAEAAAQLYTMKATGRKIVTLLC